MNQQPPAPLAHVQVRLFTRDGCHLCHTAWQQLEQAQRRWGFQLEATDIDTDLDLVAEHGHWVPVVAVAGKVRFRGSINPLLLERLLDATARSAPYEPGA